MSNFKTLFPSKLTAVAHTVAKNGDHVYTASFEDGTTGVIRRGGRLYVSVAQLRYYEATTEFVFSAKPSPPLNDYQRERHIVTVPISFAQSILQPS